MSAVPEGTGLVVIRANAKVVRGLEDPNEALRFLETVGRVSHMSGESASCGSADKFVRMLIRLGHESVLEHVNVTVKVTCDRAMSQQWMRHRLAAYTQESQRYVGYDSVAIVFVDPEFRSAFDKVPKRYTYAERNSPETPPDIREMYEQWDFACRQCAIDYGALRGRGAPPEDARSILPNCMSTSFYCTANLREWRHIFKERCAAGAQHNVRRVMLELLSDFEAQLPSVFADLAVA
jgi:thymidylate synthase (FAD)